MDGTNPGEAGVLAWCNSLRLSIAEDDGRERLDTQIQKHGFDFLDSYLESVFSRPKEDDVYELLKTPGRKKTAAKKTRAAIAASSKMKTVDRILEEDIPATNLQKALFDARPADRSVGSNSSHSNVSTSSLGITAHRTTMKVVTIADSPDEHRMDVDEEPIPVPTPAPIDPTMSVAATTPPVSFDAPEPTTPPAQLNQALHHEDVLRESAESSGRLPQSNPPPTPGIEVDAASPRAGHTSSGLEAAPVVISKELSMIAEGDEPEEPVELTAAHNGLTDMEMTVPLKDEPSSNSLKRKPSMSQFSGLPAPSPLRKSMRMTRDPAAFTAAPTVTPGPGSRTSWLSTARQTKALELGGTSKRVTPGNSAQDLATIASSASVGKDLGLAFALPAPRSGSLDTNAHAQAEFKTGEGAETLKGKPKASSLDGQTQQTLHAEHAPSLPSSNSLAFAFQPTPLHSADDLATQGHHEQEEGDVLDRLKKTVEDLGSRMGTGPIGKGRTGTAAAALAEMAEARAAAAARVAQRAQKDGVEVVSESETPDMPASAFAEAKEPSPVPTSEKPSDFSEDSYRRLSISELTTTTSDKENLVAKAKAKEEHSSKPPTMPHATRVADSSTSTTPPNSPPVTHIAKQPFAPITARTQQTSVQPLPPAEPIQHAHVATQPKPVFSNPPPVFSAPRPPATSTATSDHPQKEPSFKLPTTNPFSLPPPMNLGIGPSSNAFSFAPSALSAQSTKSSMFSDPIFSQQSVPQWVDTQDTDYSMNLTEPTKPIQDDADDDSWQIDEKFRSDQMWTPYGFTSANTNGVGLQDDTGTWSSFPSSTSRKGGDTGTLEMPTDTFARPLEKKAAAERQAVEEEVVDLAPELDAGLGQEYIGNEDLDMDMDVDNTEDHVPDLDDLVAAGHHTITLVKSKPEPPRSHSQQSMASSSSSSQAEHVGLFGQASRIMSTMFGANKKGKEPVKSIALAAAAAKKQHEEAEKKASRMKEMENRRQLAQQRKADEEKARHVEEERKAKEEAERRKREREEHTEKRTLIKSMKKGEDDTIKKRIIPAEPDKKPDSKPPSKDNQRTMKPPASAPNTAKKIGGGTFKHVTKQPSVNTLASSMQKSTAIEPPKSALKATPSTSSLKATASSAAKGKGKAKAPPIEKDDVQPSQLVQSQMANRAKAQMQATTPRQPPPPISENIELPDIHSEYSDSDDEDRKKTYNLPEWAQSPELRQTLEQQSHIDPDTIFGPIGPLRMEEIFRTRQSRFRSRTSSGIWDRDAVTAAETEDYAQRMGYRREE